MICPECCGSFETLFVDYIELDACTSCGAVWFDRGELAQLMGNRLRESSHGGPRACPRCQEKTLLEAGSELAPYGFRWCSSCNGSLVTRSQYRELVPSGRVPGERSRLWLVGDAGSAAFDLLSGALELLGGFHV